MRCSVESCHGINCGDVLTERIIEISLIIIIRR